MFDIEYTSTFISSLIHAGTVQRLIYIIYVYYTVRFPRYIKYYYIYYKHHKVMN